MTAARQRNPRGFIAPLRSAACEWFLIFFLFVDAALSYLLTKFADRFELQSPCFLCSRLDHVFGKHYKSLLCSNHRQEISSLVFCRVHSNLADVREMCEECFVSLSAENRLTMSRTWMEMSKSSEGPWRCTCCNKSWKARSSAHTLDQLTPVGFGGSRANVKPPLPRAPSRSRFSRRGSFRKIRERLSSPKSPRSVTGVDHLSHVGYTELKIASDTDSEFPFSDDDSIALEKARGSPDRDLSVLINRNNGNKSDSLAKHGLDELDWEQSRPPVMAEVMSLDITPRSSVVSEAPHVPGEISNHNTAKAPENPNVTDNNNKDSAESYRGGEISRLHAEQALSCSSKLIGHKKSASLMDFSKAASPRAYGLHDEFQRTEACSSEGKLMLRISNSLERCESGSETMEGFMVSEIKGESMVDRLKRQVEHDQKVLKDLIKELEEERNASAIAANQAMAMITRLQEEKAALQMEALQYLRMMEELSEFET